jgi:hypothetical protein
LRKEVVVDKVAKLKEQIATLKEDLRQKTALLKQAQNDLVKAQVALADIRPHAIAIADLAGNPRKS